MTRMMIAIPTPIPVIESGVPASAQKPGFARERSWWPSGGVPTQSSSSQSLMPLTVPGGEVARPTDRVGKKGTHPLKEETKPMADPNARDTKLIQYLNEAYGKEKELETALQAHIAMTTKAPYKKRLQEHLRETKGHAREVSRRIKQLGGKAEAGPISSGPDVVVEAATGITAVASKAVAAAQGPLHAIRGTGMAEKMLKNARTEFHNEFEEIGFYAGIESLAETVGDKDTAKLARTIRREEERMAKFLAKQIEQLAKAVAREEIPAAERRNGGSSRRRSSSSSRRSSSSSRSSSNGRSTSSSSKSRSGSSTKAKSGSGSRTSASRKSSGSSSSRSRASASRSGSTRAKSTRSGSSRSGGSRSKTSSRSRSR
jgi:ferritin-like metal-binding protein YciE